MTNNDELSAMPAAINRERARAAFAAYVEPYDATDPRIALKVDHTLRVAELCARIAEASGFAPAGIDLAWLCGLLHDIGRFEQVRRWGTFNDRRSAPHAALGVDVLFEGASHLTDPAFTANPATSECVLAEDDAFRAHARAHGFIRAFCDDPALDDLIRAAVAHHSEHHLPEGLDLRTRALCDLVRDADKIDILHLLAIDTVENVMGISADELLSSIISPSADEAFFSHRTMSWAEQHTPADGLVNRACFAYELVYPASLEIADEAGDLYLAFERPYGITEAFHDPATRFTLNRMDGHLRAWVDARLSA